MPTFVHRSIAFFGVFPSSLNFIPDQQHSSVFPVDGFHTGLALLNQQKW